MDTEFSPRVRKLSGGSRAGIQKIVLELPAKHQTSGDEIWVKRSESVAVSSSHLDIF